VALGLVSIGRYEEGRFIIVTVGPVLEENNHVVATAKLTSISGTRRGTVSLRCNGTLGIEIPQGLSASAGLTMLNTEAPCAVGSRAEVTASGVGHLVAAAIVGAVENVDICSRLLFIVTADVIVSWNSRIRRDL
jgi:hypothetical protein